MIPACPRPRTSNQTASSGPKTKRGPRCSSNTSPQAGRAGGAGASPVRSPCNWPCLAASSYCRSSTRTRSTSERGLDARSTSRHRRRPRRPCPARHQRRTRHGSATRRISARPRSFRTKSPRCTTAALRRPPWPACPPRRAARRHWPARQLRRPGNVPRTRPPAGAPTTDPRSPSSPLSPKLPARSIFFCCRYCSKLADNLSLDLLSS